jgi:fructose-1,6-bisphosphatase/inositol monophosphatase family enzyme
MNINFLASDVVYSAPGNREIGCWPWDVCAGIVIAEEAGGIVTGSKGTFVASADGDGFGDVSEDILAGRKYIVVRAIADIPVSEKFIFGSEYS